MENNNSSSVKLEKINGNKGQIDALYELLRRRRHNISHTSIPTIDDHTKFVTNHPYRAWYLIKFDGHYVGSTYILDSNCIGFSTLGDDDLILPEVLNFMFKKHKPLKEIKSLRPPYFFINISPSNEKLKSQLERLGAKNIQVTYSLNSLFTNP